MSQNRSQYQIRLSSAGEAIGPEQFRFTNIDVDRDFMLCLVDKRIKFEDNRLTVIGTLLDFDDCGDKIWNLHVSVESLEDHREKDRVVSTGSIVKIEYDADCDSLFELPPDDSAQTE